MRISDERLGKIIQLNSMMPMNCEIVAALRELQELRGRPIRVGWWMLPTNPEIQGFFIDDDRAAGFGKESRAFVPHTIVPVFAHQEPTPSPRLINADGVCIQRGQVWKDLNSLTVDPYVKVGAIDHCHLMAEITDTCGFARPIGVGQFDSVHGWQLMPAGFAGGFFP